MKKIILFVLAVIILVSLVSCNKQIFDTQFTFNYAYIYDTGGKIVKEGNIDKWTDYEDGEQLQITFEDGEVWLTNSTRCDLVNK